MTDIAEDNTVDKDILASLAFTQMGHRQLDVQTQAPHPNTCRWILDLPTYQEWCLQLNGLLWIKGKPGSGKSTLMSSLYTSLYDRPFTNTDLQLEFFFSARGTQLQHTFEGMLRSLLNQLFKRAVQCRAIVRRYYVDKCAAFGQRTNAWEWHERELKSLLFESILVVAQHQRVFIFVDALDETGESAARTIAEYFHSINDRVATISAPVKIFISCRHYPVISDNRGTEVCVEDYNHTDIVAYVRDRFEPFFRTTDSTGLNCEQLLPLRTALIQRANGVFQWIRLAVKIVEECVYDGLVPGEIWLKVHSLPEEISDMYEHILLHVIKPQLRSQAFLLFQWACLAEEPLTVTEMRYALASIAAFPSSRYSPQITCCETSGFIKTDAIMRQRIRALSGGLLEVVNQRVYVGHQTMKDFLIQRGLGLLGRHYTICDTGPFAEQSGLPISFSPSTVVQQCQSRLYWSCLKYIATEMVVIKVTEHHPYPERRIGRVSEHSPFVVYAVKNVFVHAEKAGQHRTQSLVDQIDLMERVKFSRASVYSAIDLFFQKCPTVDATPLHMAAGAGLNDIVIHLLQKEGECDQKDTWGRSALHLAACWGRLQVAKLLIDAGADIDQQTNGTQTPLTVAAANGQVHVVRLLLEHGAALNDTSNGSKSALVSASSAGHEQVVWVLLASGMNANSQPGLFCSALYAASSAGHEEVVRMLIGAGVDVNVVNTGVDSALCIASYRGHERVAQTLINAGADINALSQGLTSGTPLHAASWQGHEKVVQVLADAGADFNALGQGLTSGTPLYIASLRGHEKVVRVLIDAGADFDALGQGPIGRNPLYIASLRGHEKVVQIFVDAGADVNALGQGHIKSTPLYAASSLGHEKVVQVLIDAGVDINPLGGKAPPRAPLYRASLEGYEKVVQILIDASTDVNARRDFDSAIRAASSCGHDKIAGMLISAKARLLSSKIEPG